jgi:hypothetical protein
MTDHLIANDPITAELQERAVDAFRKADKAEGLRRGSRLMLTYCLIQTWAAPVEAIVKNQKGETVFSHAFTVGDYCDDTLVAAACGDNAQARGAMAKAVIARLSGIAEPSSAQKQALNAARGVAFGLMQALDGDAEKVTLTKRGNVAVPGHIMLKAPDPEKASESQIETYERESQIPFTLDGSKGRSFNELSSRVRPKQEREGQSGQGSDAGKAMSRLDAARVLLRGAVGGDEWVEYLAALSSAEIVVMVRCYGERDEDKAA